MLHDAVLNHFFLGQLSESEYVDEFVYNYGEWNRALGRQLWRERAGSGADERYFRYPMLKRVAERARAVVVHNPAAAAAVKEHAPGARVVEIPHLFAPPQLPDEAAVLRYRASLGVPPEPSCSACSAICANPSGGCGAGGVRRLHARNAATRAADRRAVRIHRSGTRGSAAAAKRPAYGACRIWRRANSGWRRAPWTPASICAIRRRARVPGSRFA